MDGLSRLLEIFVSLLVGGFAGTLITLVTGYYAQRRERKRQFLDDQVRKLYGPLYYLVSQSEKLLELSGRVHAAYGIEYEEKRWSDDPDSQAALVGETEETLKLANSYVEQVVANNRSITKVLAESYALVDPEDLDTMLLFFEHHVRLSTERDTDGALKTPLRVYGHVGAISFLLPEVVSRIKTRFLAKKRELDRLTAGRTSRAMSGPE